MPLKKHKPQATIGKLHEAEKTYSIDGAIETDCSNVRSLAIALDYAHGTKEGDAVITATPSVSSSC